MSDRDYLREALRYAKSYSHDSSTQCGAVLVVGRKLVYAANQFPAGLGRGEPLTRETKYLLIEHAERAAIYKAAACGVPTAGATLYAPWFACCDCARGIILAGIREVVGLMRLRLATPERWEANIQKAEEMLVAAGVGVRWIADPVGVTITFNGGVLEC